MHTGTYIIAARYLPLWRYEVLAPGTYSTTRQQGGYRKKQVENIPDTVVQVPGTSTTNATSYEL